MCVCVHEREREREREREIKRLKDNWRGSLRRGHFAVVQVFLAPVSRGRSFHIQEFSLFS